MLSIHTGCGVINVKLIPCKHLDHDQTRYPGCELIAINEFGNEIKYFKRDSVVNKGLPINVQFCKKRGRINNILDCYDGCSKSCYEVDDNSCS